MEGAALEAVALGHLASQALGGRRVTTDSALTPH